MIAGLNMSASDNSSYEIYTQDHYKNCMQKPSGHIQFLQMWKVRRSLRPWQILLLYMLLSSFLIPPDWFFFVCHKLLFTAFNSISRRRNEFVSKKGSFVKKRKEENQLAYYETIAGGMGAEPIHKSRSAVHSNMIYTLNIPVESLVFTYLFHNIQWHTAESQRSLRDNPFQLSLRGRKLKNFGPAG